MSDLNYSNQGVYHKQGGKELVVAADGIVTFESGALRSVAGKNLADVVSFAAAAGASNVCEVTITVKDGDGTAITYPINLDVWLSDASTGAGLTATTASGAVAAKAASGTDLGTLTSKKALRVQTKADGTYILSITDTAKTGFYVCATIPATGVTAVSTQLVAGNYGA